MKKFLLVCLMAVFAMGGVFAAGQQDSDVQTIGISIPSADHGWTG